MNLYLMSQEINEGYDTYDSVVVAAESEEDARTIHPSEYVTHITDGKWMGTYSGGPNPGKEYDNDYCRDWCKYSQIDQIKIELLGTTNRDRGVILASFNAG